MEGQEGSGGVRKGQERSGGVSQWLSGGSGRVRKDQERSAKNRRESLFHRNIKSKIYKYRGSTLNDALSEVSEVLEKLELLDVNQ